MSDGMPPKSPLAPAPGSGHTCCLATLRSERLCGKPATHRKPVSGWTYCQKHAQDVAEMFGYDQIDFISPNAALSQAATTRNDEHAK